MRILIGVKFDKNYLFLEKAKKKSMFFHVFSIFFRVILIYDNFLALQQYSSKNYLNHDILSIKSSCNRIIRLELPLTKYSKLHGTLRKIC